MGLLNETTRVVMRAAYVGRHGERLGGWAGGSVAWGSFLAQKGVETACKAFNTEQIVAAWRVRRKG